MCLAMPGFPGSVATLNILDFLIGRNTWGGGAVRGCHPCRKDTLFYIKGSGNFFVLEGHASNARLGQTTDHLPQNASLCLYMSASNIRCKVA